MLKLIYLHGLLLILTLDYANAHTLSLEVKNCVQLKSNEFSKMDKVKIVTINNIPMKESELAALQSTDLLTVNISYSGIKLPFNEANFDNLMVLHASNNGLSTFEDIGNDTFPSLKWLNVSHNWITSMKSVLFDHMKELEVVDLSYNCLTHFYFGIELIRHENINKLNLQGNLLKSFSAGFLSSLKHLHVLDLSFNQLTEFKSISHVFDELILNNNLLQSVQYIQKASSNQTLLAQYNNITRFESNVDFALLNVSHNQFQDLHSFSIGSAYSLDLSYNQIRFEEKDISESDYFEEYSNEAVLLESSIKVSVRNFNLSYNNIHKINNVEGLERFKSVQRVDLHGNKITEIDHEKLIDEFPKLTYVCLIDNQLKDHEKKRLNFHSMFKVQYELEAPTEPPPTTTTAVNLLAIPGLITLAPLLPIIPLPIMTMPVITTTTTPRSNKVIESEEHFSSEIPELEISSEEHIKISTSIEQELPRWELISTPEPDQLIMKINKNDDNGINYLYWSLLAGTLLILTVACFVVFVLLKRRRSRRTLYRGREGQDRLIEFEQAL